MIDCQVTSCLECTEGRKEYYCPKTKDGGSHCFEEEDSCEFYCALKCFNTPVMCGCTDCLVGTNRSYCPDPEARLKCVKGANDCANFCNFPCFTQNCGSSLVFDGVKYHLDMKPYYSAGWKKVHQSNFTEPFYLSKLLVRGKYMLVGCGNMRNSDNMLDVASIVKIADIKQTKPPSESFQVKLLGRDSPPVYWYYDLPIEEGDKKLGAFGYSLSSTIRRETCDTIDGIDRLCFSVSLNQAEQKLPGYRCGNWNVKLVPQPVKPTDVFRFIFVLG